MQAHRVKPSSKEKEDGDAAKGDKKEEGILKQGGAIFALAQGREQTNKLRCRTNKVYHRERRVKHGDDALWSPFDGNENIFKITYLPGNPESRQH